jgi:hypothetical protein
MRRAAVGVVGFAVAVALFAIAFDFHPALTALLAAALTAAAWPWWPRR